MSLEASIRERYFFCNFAHSTHSHALSHVLSHALSHALSRLSHAPLTHAHTRCVRVRVHRLGLPGREKRRRQQPRMDMDLLSCLEI